MKKILIFLVGAGVGSAVTYKIVKKRFEDIADEEIKSVVDRFKKNEEMILKRLNEEEIEENENDKKQKNNEKEAINDIINKAKKIANNYNNPNVQNEEMSEDDDLYIVEDPKNENELEDMKYPYIISEDDYGTFEYYGTKILNYYKDGTLTNEVDDVILDKTGWLGPDVLKDLKRGAYDDGDTVYVRDDTNEMDFEIIIIDKKFSEISKEEFQ